MIHSAVEEFAGELTAVIRRFLKAPSWRGHGGIVLGGGFRASRVGELAIGRTEVMLKADGHADRARAHPQSSGRGRASSAPRT